MYAFYLPNAFLAGVGDEPSGLCEQDKAGTNHFLPSTIALNFASLRNWGWGDPTLILSFSISKPKALPSSSSSEQARASHKGVRAVLLAFLPGTPSANVNLT